MMFVPAHALDVVERVRSMAQEALVHLRVSLPGDALIHHLEMHHVVAGWRLMALRAVFGRRGGVQKPCESPTRGVVAAGAVAPKQFAVRIAIAMTTRAVQLDFFCRLRHWYPEKSFEVVHHLARHTRMAFVAYREMGTDFKEGGMIHFDRPGGSQVLHMAAPTILNIGVKCRWLLA